MRPMSVGCPVALLSDLVAIGPSLDIQIFRQIDRQTNTQTCRLPDLPIYISITPPICIPCLERIFHQPSFCQIRIWMIQCGVCTHVLEYKWQQRWHFMEQLPALLIDFQAQGSMLDPCTYTMQQKQEMMLSSLQMASLNQQSGKYSK